MLDSPHHNLANKHSILNRLGRGTKITADLQVEVDQVAFSVFAENEKIVVRFNKISDMRLLANKVSRIRLGNKHSFHTLEAVLDRINLTVYVQNRFLRVLGPNANPILKKIFYWYAARTAYQAV
jgi:hypothetical protein